jgi:Peptidase M15
MRVPSPTTGTTSRSRASSPYLRAAVPDFSGLVRGADAVGGAIAANIQNAKAEADQSNRYKAAESLIEFNAQAQERANKWQMEAVPGDPTLKQRVTADYQNHEDQFIAGLPPELQEEFRVKVAETRVGVRGRLNENVYKQEEQADRFKAVEQFSDFIAGAKKRAVDIKNSSAPDDTMLAGKVKADYAAYKEEFLGTLPPQLQDEFRMRAGEIDIAIETDADLTQDKNIKDYQSNSIARRQNEALQEISDNPDSLAAQKALIDEAIDNSAYSETEKFYMRQQNAMLLEKQAYKEVTKSVKFKATTYMGELVQGTKRLSDKYGIPTKDILTLFSFETGGTFSVDQVGGKGNAHLGLIQFGPAEQKKYGVRPGMSATEQLGAVEAFLDDRGFKPGMSLMDMYSTINAGSPGKANASDAANGGTWGTVGDKVTHQMGDHAANADKLLSGPDAPDAPRIPIKARDADVASVAPEVVDAWERVQGAFGQQLDIVSGYRDPGTNTKAGGAKDSQHIHKTALDIDTSKLSKKERLRLIEIASASGFTGIGVYANNLHFDMREGPRRMWGPTHSKDSVPAWAFQAGIKHRSGAMGGITGAPVDFGQHQINGVQAAKGEYLPPDDLDSDPRFLNVPFEDRNAIRNSVGQEVAGLIAEQSKQAEEARKAAVDSLYVGLLNGQNDRADIDEMIKQGTLSSYDEQNKAIGILEKKEKDGEEERKAAARLASGNVFDYTDSEDKKLLNKLFGQEGTDAVNQRNQEYVTQKMLPMVEKTGAIPSDAIGTLGALARSSDGRNAVFALQTLNALENVNPSGYAAQVPSSLRHKADLYETLVGTMPEKQLFEMLADAPTSEQRNAREFYRKEAENLLQPSNLQGVKFADQFPELDGGPVQPAAVQAQQEWNTLFTDNYSRTGGNQEAALALTNKQFARVWKKTEIDGADALMKYPPEHFIMPLGGSFDWATKQVRGELGLVEGENVFLHSDATTAKEVAAMQAGQPVKPSWLVFVKKQNGQLEVLRGPDGYMRQTFQPTEADMAQHELDLRIKSKELELENNERLMAPPQSGRGAIRGVPAELVDRNQRLQDELNALSQKAEQAKTIVDDNYKFPAQKRADKLERQMFDLMDEQLTWEGPRKDWPKNKELFAVERALTEAKREAEAEREQIEKKAKE